VSAIEDWLLRLLDAAAGAGDLAVVAAAFGLAFGETALLTDLFVPGDVGMILVGAVASRSGTSLPLVILAAAVGATLGDSVGWWLGHRFGRRLLARFPRIERRLSGPLDRAEAYFGERGGAAVFWGRFVGAIRGVVSFVAGTAGMPYRRFFGWNVAASICWTTIVITAGYLFGRNVTTVVSEAGLAVAITVVLVAVAIVLHRRHRRARRSGGPGPVPPTSPAAATK